jgi:hypothetical protein
VAASPGSPYEAFLEDGIERVLDGLEETSAWWGQQQGCIYIEATNGWSDCQQHIDDLGYMAERRSVLRELPLTARALEIGHVLAYHRREPLEDLPTDATEFEAEDWMQTSLHAVDTLKLFLASTTWGFDPFLPRALPTRTVVRSEKPTATPWPVRRERAQLDLTAFAARWSGDANELRGHEQYLEGSPNVCDQLFESKAEAFSTGLTLGERRTRPVFDVPF